MAWKSPFKSDHNIQTNVPDYEKMLQEEERQGSADQDESQPTARRGLSKMAFNTPKSKSTYLTNTQGRRGFSLVAAPDNNDNADREFEVESSFHPLAMDQSQFEPPRARTDRHSVGHIMSGRASFTQEKYPAHFDPIPDIPGSEFSRLSLQHIPVSSAHVRAPAMDTAISSHSRYSHDGSHYMGTAHTMGTTHQSPTYFQSRAVTAPSSVSVMHHPYTFSRPPAGGSTELGMPITHTAPPCVPMHGTGQVAPPAHLVDWQRIHQEQLNKQQQAAALTMHGSGTMTSSVPLSYTGGGGVLADDSHKWDSIKLATDNIIRDKNRIIDKQKAEILELQHKMYSLETKLQDSQLHMHSAQGDAVNIRIQEYQYENSSLEAKIKEMQYMKDKEVEELNRKLDECIYENDKLQNLIKDSSCSSRNDMEKLKSQLCEKDETISDWKGKYELLEKELSSTSKKLIRIEEYIGELPTADDHKKKINELKLLREKADNYKRKISDLERKLYDSVISLKSRNKLIEKLEQNEGAMKGMIGQLEDRLMKLPGLREGGANEAEEEMKRQIQDVMEENARLKQELKKVKQVYEVTQKKIQLVESAHQRELQQVTERISEEASNAVALREELHAKEQLIAQHQDSYKEFRLQNQELLEKNGILQEKVKENRQKSSADQQRLEKKLIRELGTCVKELKSLVQVCVQRAEGQDPNISVLLGVRASLSSVHESEEEPQGGGIEALKFHLSNLRELRKDVDHLREAISEQYAEYMGENLNCTTQ